MLSKVLSKLNNIQFFVDMQMCLVHGRYQYLLNPTKDQIETLGDDFTVSYAVDGEQAELIVELIELSIVVL